MFCTDFTVLEYPASRRDQCSLRDLGHKARGESRKALIWGKVLHGGPKVPLVNSRICVSQDPDVVAKLRRLHRCLQVHAEGDNVCAACYERN